MKKLLSIVLIMCTLLVLFISVSASDNQIIYKDTITVTADGGRYQIGFVNVEFKKEFLNADMKPATFDVMVYAKNGEGTIEFTPGTGTTDFFKKVHIRVDAYEGMLFDIAVNENVQVDYKKHQIITDHFSRFCW